MHYQAFHLDLVLIITPSDVYPCLVFTCLFALHVFSIWRSFFNGRVLQQAVQDCGAVVKMTLLRLRSFFHKRGSGSSFEALGFHECNSSSKALFFHNTAPAPELLVFMSNSGSVALFFHNMPPAPLSVRFHTFMFSIVLVCLKLSGK